MRKTIAVLVGIAALALPSMASASQRQPDMGCMITQESWAVPTYAPSGLCNLCVRQQCFPLVAIASINHTRWSHWGSSTATGHGQYIMYGGPPVSVPATMQAYGLTTLGCGAGDPGGVPGGFKFKAYTKLRVSFHASGEQYQRVVNVTPTVQC